MCYEDALKTQRTRQQGLPERSESPRRSTIRSLKKKTTSFSGKQQTGEGHHSQWEQIRKGSKAYERTACSGKENYGYTVTKHRPQQY